VVNTGICILNKEDDKVGLLGTRPSCPELRITAKYPRRPSARFTTVKAWKLCVCLCVLLHLNGLILVVLNYRPYNIQLKYWVLSIQNWYSFANAYDKRGVSCIFFLEYFHWVLWVLWIQLGESALFFSKWTDHAISKTNVKKLCC
jgi:hypothetical protein